MGIAAFAMLLLTVVLEFAIGIRLFWLSRKTKGAAEASMGLAWIGDASGQVLNAVAKALEGTPSFVVGTIDVFVSVAAIFVLALGVQRIFEPHQERLGKLIVGTGALGLVLYTGYLTAGSADYGAKLGALAWSNRLLALAVLSWMGASSYGAFASLRKQQELGLSHPFEADRFLLWSVSAAIFVAYVLLVIGREVFAVPAELVRALQPIMALLSVGGIWVTFFPPRWLERRYGLRAPS